MAGDMIVCEKNSVSYISIRKAMVGGARTADELKKDAGVCGECAGCKEHLDRILGSVCSCMSVSLQAVVDAVKAGADTVEKVGEATMAGTGCGRCQALIANVIAQGR
ncbi:MAG: (2Fe-2S)-binding protein [Treponema sp.]|nr:(2Fe-2S)-binding protein [Treponema sp.]